VVFLSGWVVRLGQAHLQAGVGHRMSYRLAGELFSHLQAASMRAHSVRSTGDLVKRVTADSGCVRVLLLEVVLPLISSLLALAGVLVIMWRLDPVLAVVAGAAGPLFGLCLRHYARPMEQRSYEQMQAQGEIMAAAEQTLTALPIVRAFGREPHEDARFSALCRRSDQAYLRTLTAQLRFKVSTNAVTAAGTAAVIAVGGLHVLGGRLSVGTLFVFTSYLASLYAPLETFAYASESVAAATASARRVLEVMNERDHISDAPGARDLSCAGPPRIQFEGVSFGYRPGASALIDVSLDVHPGEVVALVGRTGAGKSTLVSLIPRFNDALEGRVLVGGADVRTVRLASLRAVVGVVPQEPQLLALTVAENIAYGRPAATREEIVAAAVAANADQFIRRLPEGYDTPLGQRGATLSGGERQRLAIARALLKDAPLLILDEPTAALDGETERLVLEAVERLTAGRTTLIIAHRFSTVRRASRIAVLDEGRIVESGTHDQLYALGGTYRLLCDLQSPVGVFS
jgi:ATP-binding cassette subfamily B protein